MQAQIKAEIPILKPDPEEDKKDEDKKDEDKKDEDKKDKGLKEYKAKQKVKNDVT